MTGNFFALGMIRIFALDRVQSGRSRQRRGRKMACPTDRW